MRNVIRGPKVTWVDILNPTEKDVKYLKEHFKFHPLVLGELIPPGHRPKVEHHDKYLFKIFSEHTVKPGTALKPIKRLS